MKQQQIMFSCKCILPKYSCTSLSVGDMLPTHAGTMFPARAGSIPASPNVSYTCRNNASHMCREYSCIARSFPTRAGYIPASPKVFLHVQEHCFPHVQEIFLHCQKFSYCCIAKGFLARVGWIFLHNQKFSYMCRRIHVSEICFWRKFT